MMEALNNVEIIKQMTPVPTGPKGAALVVFSGGQDSTTCLFWAKRYFADVVCLSFDYGQSHKLELTKAAEICEELKVTHEIVDLKDVFGNSSSLVNPDMKHSDVRADGLPASFTPGRNLIFLSIAAAKATQHKCDAVITGICDTDFSGYPDCREGFRAMIEAACQHALDSDIRIIAPLMRLTKAETWRLAYLLGEVCYDTVREKTITDYAGSEIWNDWGYGTEDNPASQLRANGYREAISKQWIPEPLRVTTDRPQ